MEHFTLDIDPSLDGRLRAALVWAVGLPGCERTHEAPEYLANLLARVRAAGEGFLPPETKAAVRDMLRFGGYKPAGRAKPSSEYLLAAALEGGFPLVNGPVDANNAVSLEWGYPASVFDAEKSGRKLSVRRGIKGESYVFNPSGQSIELEDLLLVCRRVSGPDDAAWEPCGNPVKDSMATKVFEDAREVVAVIYAPERESWDRLDACAIALRDLLAKECKAREAGYRILPS